MNKYLTVFSLDEDGAVTVDWVVLTAAIVGLAVLVIAPFIAMISGNATWIAGDITDVVNAGINN